MDVLLDFLDGFVGGVDGVNADSVEDDAVLCKDVLRDAAGDLVEFGDGEGVSDFDVDGAEVFVGTVVA